jgi:hypothetical protein
MASRFLACLACNRRLGVVRGRTGFLANRRGTGANRGGTRRAHFYAIVGGPMVKDAA